ncbi:MAG: hypothetical protein LBG60_07255, partial [Bifidobacteriaceae bacterium]|nr:hypothetical protein [Bifidobacteriaceae bacterium]
MEPRRREPHRRTPAPADAAAAAADGPPAPADAAGAAKDGPPAAASAPARSVSPVRQVLSVGLVSVLAGWLFTWNAGSGPESDLRDAPGLRGMVTARDRQAEQLEDRREELAAEVETLVRAVAASPEQSGPDPALALAAGTAAVK